MSDGAEGALRLLVGLVTLAVVVAVLVTDVQAHARSQREHRELAAAQANLAAIRANLKATRQAHRTASTYQDTLQSSVSLNLQLLGTTQQTLNQMNVATYLEGLDIGDLQTCLTGVQLAYGQIADHNNDQAASDLSGVSSACLTIDGGGSDGLVYPFDFPDPFVLRVGGDYFAYGTNSVGGNIQIIESADLVHWSALGNALLNVAKWAVPGSHLGPIGHAGG